MEQKQSKKKIVWTEEDTQWTPVVSDDPPQEIADVAAKVEELCEFARQKGVDVYICGNEVSPEDCTYFLSETDPMRLLNPLPKSDTE